jgi:hypothetical protein
LNCIDELEIVNGKYVRIWKEAVRFNVVLLSPYSLRRELDRAWIAPPMGREPILSGLSRHGETINVSGTYSLQICVDEY